MALKLNKLTLLLAALVALSAPAYAAEGKDTAAPATTAAPTAETVKTYGELYEGEKGETVEIAFLENSDDALLLIKGVNHEYDNKVIRTTIYDLGDKGKDFWFKYKGEDYNLFLLRNDYYGYGAELHLPDYKDGTIHMSFKNKEDVLPKHILTQYEQQKDNP